MEASAGSSGKRRISGGDNSGKKRIGPLKSADINKFMISMGYQPNRIVQPAKVPSCTEISGGNREVKKRGPLKLAEVNDFMESMGFPPTNRNTQLTKNQNNKDTAVRRSGRKKIYPNPTEIHAFMESMGANTNKRKLNSPITHSSVDTSVGKSARKNVLPNLAEAHEITESISQSTKKRRINTPRQHFSYDISDVPKAKRQLFQTRRSVRKATTSVKKLSSIPKMIQENNLRGTPKLKLNNKTLSFENTGNIIDYNYSKAQNNSTESKKDKERKSTPVHKTLIKINKAYQANMDSSQSLNCSNSSSEFIELEKRFKAAEKSSPLTELTNEFRNTTIRSVKKNTTIETNNCESELQDILAQMKMTHLNYKKQFKGMLTKMETEQMKYEKKIDENMEKISTIIMEMKMPNKENASIIFKTPKLNNSLRKAAIKNLQKSNTKINTDVSMENSTRLYNSMKKSFALCTPKNTRKSLNYSDSPSNGSSTLSRKVQKQCLLLLDTPAHK